MSDEDVRDRMRDIVRSKSEDELVDLLVMMREELLAANERLDGLIHVIEIVGDAR